MKFFMMLTLGLSVTWAFSGCGGGTTADVGKEKKQTEDEHAHDHPHGPHGGEIIDLGSIHAEMVVNDKTGKVTIYILGGDAKTAAPADEDHITIRLTLGGEPAEKKLSAVGEDRSQFELVDKDLLEALEHPKEHNARIYVKYKGETLSHDIEQGHSDHHDHDDHDDHGHDH